MSTTLTLWTLLRRRSAGTSDPRRLTGVTLVVLGGWHAFAGRAPGDGSDLDSYPALAAVASGLLLIPLVTLGGAAARLTVARRDELLAALHLAGATRGRVTGITLLESAGQALLGGSIGVGGYFALIPVVRLVTFQDRPFSYGELVVPPWVLPAAMVGVVLIATASAALSLRRVAITQLGVAARVSPAGLSWTRVLPVVVAVLGFSVILKTPYAGIGVLVTFVLAGLAGLNLVGPFIIGILGRIRAARARRVTTLLAARRLIAAPKNAWRSVGGVGLATFIAGLCAALAMNDSATSQDPYLRDMVTGGFLTLAIAAVVAAVSTGVMQAGRVIDQREQYPARAMVGMDVRVMNRARMKETWIPLVAAIGTATMASGLFLVPALSFSVVTSLPVLAQYVLSTLGAGALVLAGAAAAGRVMRTVLA